MPILLLRGGTGEGDAMTITEVASRLTKAKRTGKGFNALCPAHDDKSPSLSISEGEGRKILLKCFAGCSTDAILNAIGLEMKDLFPDNGLSLVRTSTNFPPVVRLNGNGSKAPAKVAKFPNQPTTIAAVYEYADADGVILYENVRYQPKDFRQRRPDGSGGYIYNLDGVNRVPYRLPELNDAIQNGIDEIWFTEGEKDADNLRLLGFTATSFKNWTQSLNPYIKGARAVLFADHDTSGIKQANDAARIIAEVAESVKVIDLFDSEPLPDKHGKDVSDWIDARRGEGLANEDIAEQLTVIVEGSVVWQPASAETISTASGNGRFQFTFTTLNDLYKEPEETSAYVWDKTFPVGGFSIISAKPKVGKSTVLRNLAVAISRGDRFLGRDTLKGKVLYLCLEEKRNEVRRQFQLMGAEGDSILIHSGSRPQTTDDAITALKDAVAEFQPVIVFIDPLSRVIRSADFNDYRIAYALEPFIDLARNTNIHLSALHHDSKGDREGGDAILGSTALFGSVDCHLSMKKRKNRRTISSIQRYGEDLPETVIELDKDTGLICDKGDLAAAILAEVKSEILANIADGEWLKATEIKERLPNRNGGQISKAIASLFADGSLDRAGTGKRNDPYFYAKC